MPPSKTIHRKSFIVFTSCGTRHYHPPSNSSCVANATPFCASLLLGEIYSTAVPTQAHGEHFAAHANTSKPRVLRVGFLRVDFLRVDFLRVDFLRADLHGRTSCDTSCAVVLLVCIWFIIEVSHGNRIYITQEDVM